MVATAQGRLGHLAKMAAVSDGTQSRAIHFPDMAERPLAHLDLEKAIALRWALRDIIAKRLKLSPLDDDNLQSLLELGLVEMREGVPVVTPAGFEALD